MIRFRFKVKWISIHQNLHRKMLIRMNGRSHWVFFRHLCVFQLLLSVTVNWFGKIGASQTSLFSFPACDTYFFSVCYLSFPSFLMKSFFVRFVKRKKRFLFLMFFVTQLPSHVFIAIISSTTFVYRTNGNKCRSLNIFWTISRVFIGSCLMSCFLKTQDRAII